MILPDKRPQERDFANITDYSLECPTVQESSSPSFISLLMAKRPEVDDTDDSTCLWSNIFTFNRTFATMLVIEKFSDCLEYVSSINIHEQEY